jgi:formylmethanofuran dehydrogenase subunit A
MLERKEDIMGLFELLASHREAKSLSWREFESGCRIIGEKILNNRHWTLDIGHQTLDTRH